jgi:hypothetical protein
MSRERSNIDFPFWRKKVDNSILNTKKTVIPNWLHNVWSIAGLFGGVRSKTDSKSKVKICFNDNEFEGYLTETSPSGRTSPVYILYFDEDLQEELRDAFLMTYMRSIEGDLRKSKSKTKVDIEAEISFWEFLDIEFDSSSRIFQFAAHYKQKPQFEELFRRLTKSPAIKTVSDEIIGKENRIHKQDWNPRSEYRNEIGAENVIYTLLDTASKLIYVGEAKNLITRFNQGHSEIKDWDFYKYNVLPKALNDYRVTIERMVIRDLAALLPNKQKINTKNLSDYKLVNKKIDK